MEQQRMRKQDQPDRSSSMEQADGTREGLREGEAIRNQDEGKDLGSSSDRAMFDDQGSAEERESRSRSRSSGRASGSSTEFSRNSVDASDRDLDRERLDEDQLRDRDRSDSER